MMGFLSRKEAPPPRPKPLPIQGMLRRKSGDGLVAPLLPPTRQKNLSPTTLHNILASMLLAVFVGYCVLMFFLLRQHQQQSILDSTTWGPTGHNMGNAQQILRDHVKTLVDERRKEIDGAQVVKAEDPSLTEEEESNKARKVVEGPLGQGGVTAFEQFENLEQGAKTNDMNPQAVKESEVIPEGAVVPDEVPGQTETKTR